MTRPGNLATSCSGIVATVWSGSPSRSSTVTGVSSGSTRPSVAVTSPSTSARSTWVITVGRWSWSGSGSALPSSTWAPAVIGSHPVATHTRSRNDSPATTSIGQLRRCGRLPHQGDGALPHAGRAGHGVDHRSAGSQRHHPVGDGAVHRIEPVGGFVQVVAGGHPAAGGELGGGWMPGGAHHDRGVIVFERRHHPRRQPVETGRPKADDQDVRSHEAATTLAVSGDHTPTEERTSMSAESTAAVNHSPSNAAPTSGSR